MSSPETAAPAEISTAARPRQKVWKFWGTCLWGALIFAAMFAGQFALVACFLVFKGPPFDLASMRAVAGSGTVISLSARMGLRAVVVVSVVRLSGAAPDLMGLPCDRYRCAGGARRRLGHGVARDRPRGRTGFHGRCLEIRAGRRCVVAAWG